MREIKVRYTYKRKEDGKVWQQILSLASLVSHGICPACEKKLYKEAKQ